MQLSHSAVVVAYAMLAVGCTTARTDPSASLIPPAATEAPETVATEKTVPPVPVVNAASGTVSDLVRRAYARHPTAEALRATRDVALAREATARAWANPELEMVAGRTRPRQEGLDSDLPYGASLKQRLEWPGKRDARQRAAHAQTAAVEADAAAIMNDLEAEVRMAIIALGAAREEMSQAAADATLADQVRSAIEQGHAVGDRDTATLTRARLEAATAQLRHDAAKREAEVALVLLQLWCGEDIPDPLPVTGVLPAAMPPLDPGHLSAAAQRDPRIAALAAHIKAAEAQVAAERSARTPDVTIGVFADREDEKDTMGLSLGIELPVWNQNNGPIAEADAHRRLAAAELRQRQVEQHLSLTSMVNDYETARSQAESLRTTVLPLAEDSLRLRTLGFTNGDFSLTDLLEARRAMLLTQAAALDARRRAAEGLVRLGQLVGRYDLISTIPSPQFLSPETTP